MHRNTRRLRSLRIERELTQESLAELAGTSVRTIQRAEKGESVSWYTLRRINRALRQDDSFRENAPGKSEDTCVEYTIRSLNLRGIFRVVFVLTVAFLAIGAVLSYFGHKETHVVYLDIENGIELSRVQRYVFSWRLFLNYLGYAAFFQFVAIGIPAAYNLISRISSRLRIRVSIQKQQR